MRADTSDQRFSPFKNVLMLRLDIAANGDNPARVHYITPFVTDGQKLYIFEEPGDRSIELDDMLLNRAVEISSVTTGDLAIAGEGQRANAAEEAWARDACSARFHYDQALQDLAQLGTVIAIF